MIRLDGTLRDNAQVSIDERVKVRVGGASDAHSITLSAPDASALSDEEILATRMYLAGRVVTPGDKVTVTVLARGDRSFQIVESEPAGRSSSGSRRSCARGSPRPALKVGPSNVRYEDIGGLDRELSRVRELIELPMKYPQLFSRMRIEPPRGVLLYGPPGNGQDADRAGRRHRGPGDVHPRQRPRDHAEVRRRVRGPPARGVRAGARARRRRSSSWTRSTPSPRSAPTSSATSRSASSPSC